MFSMFHYLVSCLKRELKFYNKYLLKLAFLLGIIIVKPKHCEAVGIGLQPLC
jgi:hypothetical protein